MIELKDVRFAYGKNVILNDIDFKVENGEFVGLIGINGVGKTTLLRVILSLLKPQKGVVKDDFRRSSFISQVTVTGKNAFSAKVKEVVSLGLKYKPFSFMFRKDWDKVYDALDVMGVRDLAERQFNDLSGGQQQRVRLAKALVDNPDLLVMDEPTTGMDVNSRIAFFDEVKKLHLARHLTVILVTHFYEDLRFADKTYRLQDGKIRLEKID